MEKMEKTETKKIIFEELTKPEDIKTFNDIKDIYKYRYTRDRLNTEFADKILTYTPSYRKTNKTRENWLNTAKLYGANLHTKRAKKLSRTAVQSFYYYSPQNNLNREGKRYVKLDLVMWVKAFYEGANVGKEVKA